MENKDSSDAVERSLFLALDGLTRADTRPWAEMFHESGVMEFPFAPPGNPRRLEGREKIADYIDRYPEHVALRSVTKRGSYSADGVLVVEFSAEGVAVQTGNPFEMDYVGIISHFNGRITLYRDYWNPLVAKHAMGRSEDLLAEQNGVGQ